MAYNQRILQQPPPAPIDQRSDTTRLATFLNDILALGCLKGFRYFEMYVRGREELLLRVYNDSQAVLDHHGIDKAHIPNSASVARSNKSITSPKTQKFLSMMSNQKPPLSPLDVDLEKDTSKTTFLIAGYARYRCPYVWLRSCHAQLLRTSEADAAASKEADNPLKLDSVAKWKQEDVPLHLIIAELLHLTLTSNHKRASLSVPKNLFAVDHEWFESLPVEEVLPVTAGMLNFLTKVWMNCGDDWLASGGIDADEVFEDIKILQERYFTALLELYESNLDEGSIGRQSLDEPSGWVR